MWYKSKCRGIQSGWNQDSLYQNHGTARPGMGKEFLMVKNETSPNPKNRIWMFFASVKLTVALLLTLAVTSIIGTVIPQNESPAAYVNAYGENLYRIFSVLNFLTCIVPGGSSY
jgi:hypothetical protein